MAQVITSSVFQNLEAAIVNIANNITGFFVSVVEANARKDEFEKLHALTDEQLRVHYGINRSEIVSYVFRDKLV